mmetsp:Transcript_14661/g.33663  ORF Transcript_14661/g.33663 Transcript_14661/m.33663 type:complete len:207 (+) Transcript_14661:1878-2498(+)
MVVASHCRRGRSSTSTESSTPTRTLLYMSRTRGESVQSSDLLCSWKGSSMSMGIWWQPSPPRKPGSCSRMAMRLSSCPLTSMALLMRGQACLATSGCPSKKSWLVSFFFGCLLGLDSDLVPSVTVEEDPLDLTPTLPKVARLAVFLVMLMDACSDFLPSAPRFFFHALTLASSSARCSIFSRYSSPLSSHVFSSWAPWSSSPLDEP